MVSPIREREPDWDLEPALVQRFYKEAGASQWSASVDAFATLLTASARRAFPDAAPSPRELERYLASLHLADLALACACAEGAEPAWEHFIREFRPVLYRAADALDAAGGAREAADSLYGELFGLGLRDGVRVSHFRYFHGRSSLGTWLRAVLSQRYVDRVRRDARLAPLPEDDAPAAPVAPAPAANPRLRTCIEVMRRTVAAAVAALVARDRLRLRCYYAQDLTLAQIGKTLGEHEATVSRNLARTRRQIREQVETMLREREGMPDARIAECFEAVSEDAGPLDMAELLGTDEVADPRKKAGADRSK